MSNYKVSIEMVDWSHAVCEEILCKDVATLVDLKAREVQARANKNLPYDESEGYGFEAKNIYLYHSNRHMAWVHTTDYLSSLAEREHDSLTKALYR